MKKIFLGIFVMFLFMNVSEASDKITLKKLNEIVEQTNFFVDKGCSGTLIDHKNKLILTNYHCIENKVSIVEVDETNIDGIVKKIRKKKYVDVFVEQNGYEKFEKVSTSTYISEIVAEDKKVDLAVLKIKTEIPHKISSKINTEKYPVFAVLEQKSKGKTFVRVLYVLFGFLLLVLFLPWTQNIQGPGIITTRSPEERPQELNAIIAGRIEKWFVLADNQLLDTSASKLIGNTLKVEIPKSILASSQSEIRI